MSQQVKLEMIQNANFMTDSASEVREKLNKLLQAGEIRLRDIEQVTGYKAPTISQHLNGVYEGDTERLDDGIVRFYRQWIAKHTIVNTSVVQQIHGIMELAWKRRRIARINGQFGRGKSKAANRYAAQNPDYTVVVELSGVSTPRELLDRIGEALHIESQMVGSRNERLQAIIRALQRKPRLLVIDEADELRPAALKLLRDIHGDDQARCALVLIGTDRLDTLLRNPELGYMRRRIRMKLDVGDISFKEAKQVASMWPHSLDEGELKKIWEWCTRDFGIDSLVKIMDLAYDMMLVKSLKKIDTDCIESAHGYL
jgi:DNA transposition AAA+ family ATPase